MWPAAVILGSLLPMQLHRLPSFTLLLIFGFFMLITALAARGTKRLLPLMLLQACWSMICAHHCARPIQEGVYKIEGVIHQVLAPARVSITVEQRNQTWLWPWERFELQLTWDRGPLPEIGARYACTVRALQVVSQYNQGRPWISNLRSTWRFCRGQLLVAEKKEDARAQRLQVYPDGPLLQGILEGNLGRYTPAIKKFFQKSGCGHLVIFSSLHSALALIGLRRLLRHLQYWAPTGLRHPRWAMQGALLVITLWRSLDRLLLAFILRHSLRSDPRPPLESTLRVIALLLIIDPLLIFAPGFWLSCDATLATGLWLSTPQRPGRVRPLLTLQATLFIALLPLQILFFQQIAWLTPVITPLALALMAWVILPPLALGVLADLCRLPWIAAPLLRLPPVGFKLLLSLIEASHHCCTPCSAHWVGPTLSLALMGLFIACASEARPLLRCTRAMVLTLWLPLFLKTVDQRCWVDMLDVGQGLAIVIRRGSEALIYDTGPSWPTGSMAERVILPYLRWHGATLQGIMISHADNDHAGGLPELKKNYPKAWVGSSSLGDRPLFRGQQWQWHDLDFQVLWPLQAVARASNQESCVIKLTAPHLTLLLTGDIGREEEAALLPTLSPSTFLQVPHHGSKTSSSYPFLKKVAPTIALLSVGRNNRWRLPAQEVLQRYSALGITVHSTALKGQLSLVINGRNVCDYNDRDHYHPHWYAQPREAMFE